MKRQFFLIITLLFLFSCKDEPMWFDNEYLFLEQHFSEYSEYVVKGVCEVPHLCFDFPMYLYNSNQRMLGGYLNDEITGDTKMLLGTGSSAGGVVSSGAGTGLKEVHELPFVTNKLTITRIDEDGTVYFVYKDSSMVLSPNEEWSKTWTAFDTITSSYQDTVLVEDDSYGWYYEFVDKPDTSIILLTYRDRVTNWGLLEKSQFSTTIW